MSLRLVDSVAPRISYDAMKRSKRKTKQAAERRPQKSEREKRAETSLGHKEKFEQLLDDAMLGVKKK